MINLSPTEISVLVNHAQEVMKSTDLICTSTSINEVETQMSAIEQSQGNVDQVLHHFDVEISKLKNSRGAVALMKKNLERHLERLIRTKWNLKNAEKRLPPAL